MFTITTLMMKSGQPRSGSSEVPFPTFAMADGCDVRLKRRILHNLNRSMIRSDIRGGGEEAISISKTIDEKEWTRCDEIG